MLHNWSLPYILTWSFVKAIPQKDICVLCRHLMQVFAVMPTVISGEVNSCYLQDKFYGQAMGHLMQNDGNISMLCLDTFHHNWLMTLISTFRRTILLSLIIFAKHCRLWIIKFQRKETKGQEL